MEFFHDPELWVAIAFLAAVYLAWGPAKQQIVGTLDSKSAEIARQLNEAQALKDEAEATLREYQQKQRDALKEAQEIVVRAQIEAERAAKQASAELEAALKRRQAQALDKIAQAEASALAEVRNAAVDVAIEATRQLIVQSLTAKSASALVDQAIAQLPTKLH